MLKDHTTITHKVFFFTFLKVNGTGSGTAFTIFESQILTRRVCVDQPFFFSKLLKKTLLSWLKKKTLRIITKNKLTRPIIKLRKGTELSSR